MTRQVAWPHPGEILNEEFLEPAGLTQYALAKEIGVPQTRISEIVSGKRSVSAETGLLLDKFFGTSRGFWSRLQADYDVALAMDDIADQLAGIKPFVYQRQHPEPA